MPSNDTFLAGFAEVDFTPAPGLNLLGQMHQRIAEGARDPLLSNAMALRQGDETVVLVSADIALIALPEIVRTQEEWQRRTGLPAGSLLIHTTHTHDAPAAFDKLMEAVVPEFLESLLEAIVQSGVQALEKLEPVEIFSGTGHMEHMGWNRRAALKDGTSEMYAHSQMENFSEMEGPRDPALPVLCFRDSQGEIKGIVVNFATHPNSIESAMVYSADVPGAARESLKRLYGDNVKVIYLTGASGNTAPSILDPYDPAQPWRGEAGLVRSGQFLAGEAAKVISAATTPMREPKLKLIQTSVGIPIREWPRPEERSHYKIEGNLYYERCEREWPEHRAQNNPMTTRISLICIGDAVICTNPAELFVEFGLEIRQTSPAAVTFISQLTDGYIGYIPTEKAFAGGGYETWCAVSSQLVPSAGGDIVRATRELLKQAYGKA